MRTSFPGTGKKRKGDRGYLFIESLVAITIIGVFAVSLFALLRGSVLTSRSMGAFLIEYLDSASEQHAKIRDFYAVPEPE